MDKTPIGIWN